MPVKSVRKSKASSQRKYDLKKLFGSDFREPTPAEYAATPMVTIDEVLAELEIEPKRKSPARAELLSQMKLQVKEMRKHLSALEKQLLKL